MPAVSFFGPDFKERVAELEENMTSCPNLQRVSEPYLQAAAWEAETGKGVATLVGVNQAIDMQGATQKLNELAMSCVGCEQSAFGDCVLADVEKIHPIDLITLLTNKQDTL